MASSENRVFTRLREFFNRNSTRLMEDNRRLQEQHDHMEIVIESQRKVTNSLKMQLSEEESLREEIRSKDTFIERLREEINNKNTEIQRLKENSINKDRHIQHLQEENINKEKHIARLQEEKDNTIRGSVTILEGIREIGRGAYGKVCVGEYYGTKVAVKEFHEIIVSDYNLQLLKREINIASQCRHPNLLQFLCAAQNDRQQLLMVTELMDISLREFIEQHTRRRSQLVPREVKHISLDVARGLNYLHSKMPSPIIHRDISSANVLLWVENGTVRRAKISDYGSANLLQLCKTSNPGAAIYAAPEVAEGQYDAKIDVFSYGILVCEMSICEIPYPADEKKNQVKRISNGRIKKLVKSCTKTEPQNRPTMQNVIEQWNKIKL